MERFTFMPLTTAFFCLASMGCLALAQPPAAQAVRATASGATVFRPESAYNAIQHAGRIAEVTYLHGRLEVTADNSSLNQILREIARQTGMKITGSIADERVYGKYGPATAGEILSILLDGTGTNMMLTETASEAPAELILTPQEGPHTPPSVRPQPTETSARSTGAEPARPTIHPAGASVSNSSSAGTSNQLPPDGFQTQQQIFEHVQQMQKMQRDAYAATHH